MGVPYTDEMIAQARSDLKAQLDPDGSGAADLQRRYPGATARNFGGEKARAAEIDALIAYLQVLGTMVDFKIYEDKKNLR
ncbi:hypothetical protein MBRA_05242 [Methylobacterium brachiatum]|nr:hypothetical protein MBRA_05242 [Methylobacterium brachiatum]